MAFDAAAVTFLRGGGEVGERLRRLDWSNTGLGRPESWPQSLRTVVRIMLDSRYAMWMLWGPELTFLCNDAYLPTVGIRREWVLGSRSDKVWEEIWPEIWPRISSVLTTGTATWDEALLLFLERSGFTEETYHTFSYSPVYGDDGVISGMLCVVTEVTNRVVSERRLALLGALGGALAGASCEGDVFSALSHSFESNAPDLPFTATYLFEPDRRYARRVAHSGFTRAHPAIPAQLTIDEGLWPICELQRAGGPITVADLTRLFAPFPGGPWTAAPRQARLLPLQKQGQSELLGFVIVGLNPLRGFDHDYAHFLDLVAAQIASGLAAVSAWEAERRRADALAAIDRAKTDFFANVSHEFRTPLTLIRGQLEQTLAAPDRDLDASVRDSLQMAYRNSERLLKLVNSLLDFSRLEAHRTTARLEPIELDAFTADLASVFRSAIETAGLHFDVDCPPLPSPIPVDPLMWENIVMNLLSNAFKYTLSGSISLSLRQQESAAVLTVTDTGAGIPAAALPNLFERFYRVPGAQGRTHEGTGIGLALVQEIVKLHHGTITVHSESGQGSRFTVSIPMQPAEATQGAAPAVVPAPVAAHTFVRQAMRWMSSNDTELFAPEAASQSAAEPVCAEPGRGIVLLAEDNADMRAYIQRLLERRFTIVTARDGQEALDYLRRSPVDLLLTDIMMPRLDGFSLLSQIRADAALRELPVVLLSARAGEEAKIEGLDVGADDYLVKPFSARELLARVTTHLLLAKTRREAHAAIYAADRRFRVALESSNIGFALLKSTRSAAGELHDFEYVDLNSAGARLLGRPLDELVGRSIGTVFPGVWNTPGLFDLYSSVLSSGEPKQTDIASDTFGAGRWFQVAAARFDDGLAVWFTDITERQKITLALEKSRQELDRVTDVASVMLAHCDRHDRYLFVNRAYASRFGLQPGEVVGRRIADVVGAQTFALVEPHIRGVLAGNRVEFEMLIPDSDGSSRLMNCVYAPDIDSLSGEVVGFVAAITDISERRRLEDRLREADRRKDEFLATLAHELRNPLAPIRHAAAVATLPGAKPDQVRRSHAVIDRQVRHMAVLLDDLLDISRITQGKLRLRLDIVDLQDVIDAAVEASRPMLVSKKHRLSVAVPPHTVQVNADSVRLAQILSNLLNNAAKYTDPGGLIRLSVTTEAGEIVIRVADNGVGIANDALPTLFTMFSQIKSALDRAEGGLGIGLSLVKGLVELHGGSVSAQSRGAGLGSEFIVRLPAPHSTRAAKHSASSGDTPAPRASRRILIADDNRDAAETLQMLLSIDGHDVRLAYDGDQAVEVAGDFEPDLMFVDIGMPKRNGYEVAQFLRQRYPGRHMRLIALSGWGQSDDKQRAHASGFDRHLTKPIDPEVIQQIVNESALSASSATRSGEFDIAPALTQFRTP